jgi:hypothetical protein
MAKLAIIAKKLICELSATVSSQVLMNGLKLFANYESFNIA